MGSNLGLKLVFFLSFSQVSQVFQVCQFLEITYNDNLEQCMTSTKGKIYEKNFGTKFGPNRPKSGSKIFFLPFS